MPPFQRILITSTASSSISIRIGAGGQGSPKTCSLRFSPDPRPRINRSGIIAAAVAAAWAMMPGWIRIVGQVTPVTSRRSAVACEMPPITLQTNGLCPCRAVQGWQ